MNLARREFLRSAGLLALPWLPQMPAALRAQPTASDGAADSAPGMLVDVTRCIGCRACSRACVEANRLPQTEEVDDINLNRSQVPTYQLWSVVNRARGKDRQGAEAVRSVKRQCMHCLEPACASVCPVAALYKTKEGPVIYRAERCIGCRYCMVACPFDVPKFQWDSGLSPVIGKCQFCFGTRLLKGQIPECAAVCPTGALKFGTRGQMLFEARARIHARPERYVDHIYGEREAGGTSWLYLSDVSFQALGFKKSVPLVPLPRLTWAVISKLPVVVFSLAGFLTAFSYYLRRKEKEAWPSGQPSPSPERS